MSPYHSAHFYASTFYSRVHARVASFLAKQARHSIRRGSCPSTVSSEAAA
jgi:hypothetical protein